MCQTSPKSSFRNASGKLSWALGVLVITAWCQLATAATTCVSQNGMCPYFTISAAVLAASPGDTIQVQAGVYSESVTIRKSLSLLGAGSGTIINAIGLPNGIFIDGTAKAPNAGVGAVTVSGFTIENANFEGILVGNANGVAIIGNQVNGNNRGLNAASLTCPGLPAFETSEGEDCGEGIHLMAVDHSVISNNVVMNNSGGILISDETGPTHDNVISGNTVSNNVTDCGITLASHPQAASAGLTAPAGVYRNTISGNTVSGNGTAVPGGGAGIGIYAPGPGNLNYSNVIINNIITGNGLPGVAMHNHAAPTGAPAPNLNDNMIIGNTIANNAADTEDAATPGTTGINIYSVVAVTGTVITGNKITSEQIGVAFNTPATGAQVHGNDLTVQTGVDNIGTGMINATFNYWGCATGPGLSGCGGVIGSVLSGAPAANPF